MTVRAKMKVTNLEPAVHAEDGQGGTVYLHPVINGSPENDQFYKYTPGGNLTLSTINGRAFEQFHLGEEYYIDISRAGEMPLSAAGSSERMLQWFNYGHLPSHLQAASRPFYDLALHVIETTDPGPERTVALRKLLEAKDAAVRAKLNPGC